MTTCAVSRHSVTLLELTVFCCYEVGGKVRREGMYEQYTLKQPKWRTDYLFIQTVPGNRLILYRWCYMVYFKAMRSLHVSRYQKNYITPFMSTADIVEANCDWPPLRSTTNQVQDNKKIISISYGHFSSGIISKCPTQKVTVLIKLLTFIAIGSSMTSQVRVRGLTCRSVCVLDPLVCKIIHDIPKLYSRGT